MKIVNISPRTPEWHQWRNTGVSASEADVVLGTSPYKTPYRLYAEKKGLILPDNLDRNPHVRRGIRLEPVAREAFELRHSFVASDSDVELDNYAFVPMARDLYEERRNVLLLPLCAESASHTFIRASFDGVDDDGIPTEIKAPSEKNFREAQLNLTKSKVYQRYYGQCQQQIFVAGSDYGWLTLYLNKTEYLDFKILRDDAYIALLIPEAKKFVECLEGKRKPPEMDPKRDIFIPTGEELTKWNALAVEYHEISKATEQLKAQAEPFLKTKSDIESKLSLLMGDFTQGESAGVRVSRFLRQGSVDFKEVFAVLCPDKTLDMLEQFRKEPTECIRCTTKTEEKATVPFSMEKITELNTDDIWF